VRKFKLERRVAALVRRPENELPFVSGKTTGSAVLLLDTCVYIDTCKIACPVP
jgi:hypothetical protein